MNNLAQRLTRHLRIRLAALRRLSGTTFIGISILTVTTISVAVLVLLGTGAPVPAPARGAVPISMTRLVADAESGQLSKAVVDETRLVVHATYGPGAPPAAARAAEIAADGGTLTSGAVADAHVLRAYLPKIVDTLIAAGVPVNPGEVTGAATPEAAAEPGTADTGAAGKKEASGSSSGGANNPATVASAATGAPSNASEGPSPWVVGLGLLGLLSGSLVIAIGSRRRRHHRNADETGETAGGRSAATRGGSGAGRFGQKKAPAVEPATVPETRFSDVAGCDEAKAELQELVMFLKEPERFTRTGATAPKGALLTGPPGTGKTLLARAVAGESGVPMFTAAGSDFVEKYVGVGAQRIRALFAAARKHERAIIFIDEVDAVARRRGGEGEIAHVESETTLIALLSEMDGFHTSNVIVIAATNRADMLDPAITRPGRLDRKVEVPNPDRRGREQILAVHTAGKPIAPGVDFTGLARRTPGFSGAQLRALVNEACVDAVRRDLAEVNAECFEHAVATIAMGRARTSALVTDHDREVTAWHESGHTLAAYLQEQADDPVQVTIIPRGPAGGVTWMSGNDDQFLPRRKAHAQLVTALAGRAAEEILLDGEFTQGAAGDLQSATELATSMATRYGMTRLGYQVRGGGSAPAKDVSDVVEELLGEAHTAATRLLGEHKTFLSAVAVELLVEETLTLSDVHQIATRLGVARHANVPSPQLPGEVRAAKPVVCMEVPLAVEEVPAGPESVGWRSPTGTAVRRHPALVRALMPWRWLRRKEKEPVIAE
ncbi:MAG: AAA family ATPase [Actinomycetota bacterium]